jgi:hypothetical protein
MLGLIERKEKREKLPSAIKEVKSKEPPKEFKSKIDVQTVRKAEGRAKLWLEEHGKVEGGPFVYYYLYALERCNSFREMFENKPEKEPRWYNEGAQFLMKGQNPTGSWTGYCGDVPDTAFGVLFLIRSTKAAIDKVIIYREGVMVGGHGIPKNTENIEVRGGQIVARPLVSGVDKLIDMLDKPDGRDFDKSVEEVADLPDEQVKSLTAKYGDKIRQLVSSKSPAARLAAVKALGKTRDLNNVEILIYALTDPDPEVVRAANVALLRIRRVPLNVPLPDNFSEEDRRLLVERWKAWYQSVRPNAEVKY